MPITTDERQMECKFYEHGYQNVFFIVVYHKLMFEEIVLQLWIHLQYTCSKTFFFNFCLKIHTQGSAKADLYLTRLLVCFGCVTCFQLATQIYLRFERTVHAVR